MSQIATSVLHSNSAELSTCAKWRLDAFPSVLQDSFDAELKSLQVFTLDPTEQVALLAKIDDIAAGTCLLVRSEL